METNGSEDVGARARETLRDVRGKMADGLEDLRGYADSADAAVRQFARERPLLAIACALGVGFVIGRLASRT